MGVHLYNRCVFCGYDIKEFSLTQILSFAHFWKTQCLYHHLPTTIYAKETVLIQFFTLNQDKWMNQETSKCRNLVLGTNKAM